MQSKIYQLIKKNKTKNYINKWKCNFNNNWKLYNIKESDIEFAEDVYIIEDYFKDKKIYINEYQYILV
jgi:hypothetical protein